MLSRDEKTQARAIREKLRVNYANLGKNLGDFDHALLYMRPIRDCVADYIRLGMPYIDKGISIVASRGMFAKTRAAHYTLKASGTLKNAAKVIFDKDTIDTYNRAMAEDPRVKVVHFSVNADDSINNVNGHVTKVVKNVELITVTFADNTKLEIHSLEDPNELARAREIYNHKLHELTPAPASVIKL